MTGAGGLSGLCGLYLARCETILSRILLEEAMGIARAAARLADEIVADRLIYIYGPGGHSNLAAQELFYRAGSLMHLRPIFDPQTALTNGAFQSTAMERQAGHGAAMIASSGIEAGNVLLLVNAFGVNAAVVDAALKARELGVTVIGLSSQSAARAIPADHPARHPSQANVHDIVDIPIDTKIPDGDAAIADEACRVPVGPVATIANAFTLNAIVLQTIGVLVDRGIKPPLWASRNASAGDCNNEALVTAMRQRNDLL